MIYFYLLGMLVLGWANGFSLDWTVFEWHISATIAGLLAIYEAHVTLP